MTEVSLGVSLAVLVIEVLMLIGAAVGYQVKEHMVSILFFAALFGAVGYLFLPTIIAGFGG